MRLLAGTLLIALVVACGDTTAEPEPVPVHAIDGDTVVWDGKVRDLVGIDAPELGQYCEANGRLYACGLDAAFALAKRAALEPADCQAVGGGVVCHIGGSSLGDLQVSDGYAFASARAPETVRLSEGRAREAHLGVWRGDHVMPSAWRAGARLASEDEAPSRPCPVIGVPGPGGATYVVPTDEAYAEQDRAEGGPRVCSDEEARALGWRHARQRR